MSDGAGTGDGDRANIMDGQGSSDGQDAARKMRKKMKEQAMAGVGASEFNIG